MAMAAHRQSRELSAQDIVHVQSLYGVRTPDWFNRTYANNSFGTAAPIGNDPSQLAFEADITQIGEAEYYKITTPPTTLNGTWTVKVPVSTGQWKSMEVFLQSTASDYRMCSS